MKKTLFVGCVAAVGGLLMVWSLRAAPPEGSEAPVPMAQVVTPSAWESDPAGWVDLLPDADLHGWKRVAYPGKQLVETTPWSRKAGEDVLRCAKLPMKGEQFLCDREFGDGVYHVEWRFAKVEGGKGYNSGVFVRNSPDGALWHQAQVGSLNVGYLFGSTRKADGSVGSFKIDDKVPQRGKEAGEWNVYELRCKGRDVSLWINGAVTASWTACEVPRGLVGLEAEGWDIEFRNVKFKETK